MLNSRRRLEQGLDFFCSAVYPLTKNNDIFVLLNKNRDQFVQSSHQWQFDKNLGYAKNLSNS